MSEESGSSSESSESKSEESSSESSGEVCTNSSEEYRTNSPEYSGEYSEDKESSEESEDTREMAVYYNPDEDPGDEDPSALEHAIKSAIAQGLISEEHVKDSDIIKDPAKAIKAAKHLHDLLKEYNSNPNKYARLARFLRDKGYNYPLYSKKGVFDSKDSPTALARSAYSQGSVEANINMIEMLKNWSSDTGLDVKSLSEIVIAHELVHVAQPRSIWFGEPSPYVAEFDAESKLGEFFGELSKESKGSEKTRYKRMSDFCYSRAGNIIGKAQENIKSIGYNHEEYIKKAA